MIRNWAATVLDTPTLLAEGIGGIEKTYVLISNTGTEDCFVGGATVTDADGVFIHKGGTTIASRETFWLTATDELWAICSAGKSTTVRVMVGGF